MDKVSLGVEGLSLALRGVKRLSHKEDLAIEVHFQTMEVVDSTILRINNICWSTLASTCSALKTRMIGDLARLNSLYKL